MSGELVEVKVTLSAGTAQALEVLGLESGKRRTTYFYDDLTPGLPAPYPLFRAGVILRLRVKPDGSGDSTVKLRPCRRSALPDGWSTQAEQPGAWRYELEWDWTGEHRVLAASLVSELTATDAAGALTDARAAYGKRQRDFLADCADLRVNLGALSPLGPIAVTKWENLTIRGVTKVNAERWTAVGLDVLELSRRVGVAQAAASGRALESAVRRLGLAISPMPKAKTELFLSALAAA